jgi:hypothetical protein
MNPSSGRWIEITPFRSDSALDASYARIDRSQDVERPPLSVTSSAEKTWKNMKASPFRCPEGTEVTYRGWSENGSLWYCEPVKNGPWEAWMSGYKWVEGNYLNGKKDGKWCWLNEEGEVTKTVSYDQGIEIIENNVAGCGDPRRW